MTALFEAIIAALSAGYGIAGKFGEMIQNTFITTFTTYTLNAETGVYTVTGLSAFGAVALCLVGIATVTGLGMLIFRRFFKRA